MGRTRSNRQVQLRQAPIHRAKKVRPTWMRVADIPLIRAPPPRAIVPSFPRDASAVLTRYRRGRVGRGAGRCPSGGKPLNSRASLSGPGGRDRRRRCNTPPDGMLGAMAVAPKLRSPRLSEMQWGDLRRTTINGPDRLGETCLSYGTTHSEIRLAQSAAPQRPSTAATTRGHRPPRQIRLSGARPCRRDNWRGERRAPIRRQ